MTWSVYQHWDPLKVCVVGRSYPPEFYSWMENAHVRNLFEKIATETEEDYQKIIKKLEEFGVEVLRPDIPQETFFNGRFQVPPMNPRDSMAMIGDTFYENYHLKFEDFYDRVRDPSWPNCNSFEEFKTLPQWIQQECIDLHGLDNWNNQIVVSNAYDKIFDRIRAEGNVVKNHFRGDLDNIEMAKHANGGLVNGAMVARIGKDLFFGTENYNQDNTAYKRTIDKEFSNTRNHIIDTGGHTDGTFCPVCPGLIISLYDVPTYADTFPGWEVVYLPKQSWAMVEPFLKLRQKNRGRWWIPGFEEDQVVIDTVEQWLGHWTGFVEETVFDVNMLMLDPKNVMVFNYNKQVFDALDRYGITPHIVTFRHRYFWDGGIHCVTSDLHREGTMQDFFPGRT